MFVPKPSQRFVASSGRVGSEGSFSSKINKPGSVPSRLFLYLFLLVGLVLTLFCALWFGEIEPFRHLPIWGRSEAPDLWPWIAFLLLTGGLFWVVMLRYEHVSDTTIRNGLLGVGTMFVSTLIAGEWGFAVSIVVIVILHGYYDSGKHQRQLDSTVREYRKYKRR